MDVFKNLIEVGSQLISVQEFYEFTEDIHKMIDYKESECDIAKFYTPMKDVIHDPNKDYDYKRNFFMAQAVKFPNVFSMMFQLKNKEGKEQAQNLIEGLISLKVENIENLEEEQKRVTEEIDFLLKDFKNTKPS